MRWRQILLVVIGGGSVLVFTLFVLAELGMDELLGDIDPKHITIREHMRMKRIKRKEKDNG